MTFFLQVAFPQDHAWEGRTLALFACVACVQENHHIPEMLPGRLAGAIVPAAFLAAYQRNFSTLVFETHQASPRPSPAPIMPRPITVKHSFGRTRIGRLGGQPDWMLDDEAPSRLDDGSPFAFLFQLDEGLRFPIGRDAPPAMEVDLFGELKPSPHRHYQLFLGNRIFFFGAGMDRVYILTQI